MKNTEAAKRRELRNHKLLATGLFVLMAVIFIAVAILEKKISANFLGYVKAFSEAAMVGALADWFAVTALFHHPFGIKIPHTNLIERSKEKIGNNLGNFVVENFLSPATLRPYIEKLKISGTVAHWLTKSKNQELVRNEAMHLAQRILKSLDDASVSEFITGKIHSTSSKLKLAGLAATSLEYLTEKEAHQPVITSIAHEVRNYILENESLIRERVTKGSSSFIPKFIDDKIADKIVAGLSEFFEEIELNPDHSVRFAISKKLNDLAAEMRQSDEWEQKIQNLNASIVTPQKLEQWTLDIWFRLKKTLLEELSDTNSILNQYFDTNLRKMADKLTTDEALKNKIDGWIRYTSYNYILRNTHQAGQLISNTVGNWDGNELSRKLELEVGKDLQYIRINGTLVGGLVGLIIYTLSKFLL